LIGETGRALVIYAVTILDNLKIDDPAGTLSVHLVNEIWGTLVCRDPKVRGLAMGSIICILCVSTFIFATSFTIWFALKRSWI
jgi:Amt family ammonium transporter